MLAACGGESTRATPVAADDAPVELVWCRRQVSGNTAEVALRSARNLGTGRVLDRNGVELFARVDPAGTRVAFTRRRSFGDASSGELYVADLRNAVGERRITIDGTADEYPCWSPDGAQLLFATDRDGDRRLWLVTPGADDARPFLSAGPGVHDDAPDWHRGTDRVVFVRRQAGGSQLHLVQGDGTGLVPIGAVRPAAQADLGVREPAFAPGGGAIAYVVQSSATTAQLWTLDVASGIERLLFEPQGLVRLPRHAPAGDRIFLGLEQPDAGRPGLRLAAIAADGSDPTLIEPGEQWQVLGIDVLPAIASRPAATAPEQVPHTAVEVQISSGVRVLGNTDLLAAADGQALVLATEPFQGREIASINCRWTLPVAAADEVLVLRARMTARVTRSDVDSALRTSLYSPVTDRFDTVAERPDPGTSARTLEFATQSLAHVSQQRHVRFQVIADLGPGARAELHVDHVQLEIVRRDVP
ncbi:MAG: TolB family protein [Planctomycetota bacterium]